jgi:murein DD-endopeptidase MepM/ murein hydrolase activator NlpD
MLLVACSQPDTAVTPQVTGATATRGVAVAQVEPSLTPTLTPTPSHTPTATATPTNTPTPTATAVPLTVTGDPLSGRLTTPVAQYGAPCGVVDVLDFPLNPPDAAGLAGGGDFGIYRSRYGKYHAGEDWWAASRGASFGEPVHSIGHGWVTYAEPLGWNVDQGVVIIQHTLANGQTILSFYGHLDPPSIVLTPGECVVRGQQVGQIGRPRGSPHLHFEVRLQSPYVPLSGYWPEDPTVMGWLPPSQTIWGQRLRSAPGVEWVRPPVAEGTKGIGVLNGDTLLVIEDGELVGLNLADGAVRWRYEGESRLSNGVMDGQRPVVYVVGRDGRVEALSLLDGQGVVSSTPGLAALWEVRLSLFGTPVLMPLPQGGVVVSVRQELIGIGLEGTVLWRGNSMGQLFAWATAGEKLMISMSGNETTLWEADETGLEAWPLTWSGYPIYQNGRLWFYTRDGVYELDMATRTAGLLYGLPASSLQFGEGLALADGGVLLAQADGFDRRLLLFAADGSLRWERSYSGLVEGRPRLLLLDGVVYLVAQDMSGSAMEVRVYRVDVETAELVHLFTGGTRTGVAADVWALAVGGRLVINIGGGHMVGFEPGAAE